MEKQATTTAGRPGKATPTWKGGIAIWSAKKRGGHNTSGSHGKASDTALRPSWKNRHQLGKGNCDLVGRQKKRESRHERVSWKSKQRRHRWSSVQDNRHQLGKGELRNCDQAKKKSRSRHERVSWKTNRRHRGRPSRTIDTNLERGIAIKPSQTRKKK